MNSLENYIHQAVLERTENKNRLLSVPRILAQYTKKNGNRFFLQGREIVDSHFIYSPEMFMPIVALEAMRLWQSIEKPAHSEAEYDDSLGIVFSESESSFFPLAAHPPLIHSDSLLSTLRLLCFNLANRRVFALKENADIQLDSFVMAWKDINWYSDTIDEIPVPEDYDNQFLQNEFVSKRADYSLNEKRVVNSNEGTGTPFQSRQD